MPAIPLYAFVFSGMKIQERFLWAVEVMDIKPDDTILEVGCGAGIAVTLVATQLKRGTITAIDQSEAMIKKASIRNAAIVASGKAIFIPAALAAATLKQKYTKIFAFNVSIFWKDASEELCTVKKLLAPQGKLYIFHQPPPGTAVAFNKTIAATVKANLEKEDFNVVDIQHKRMIPAPVVCITSSVA
jgi:ubiquinone/menaquinone biosynthesis C-methylase UbiE